MTHRPHWDMLLSVNGGGKLYSKGVFGGQGGSKAVALHSIPSKKGTAIMAVIKRK